MNGRKSHSWITSKKLLCLSLSWVFLNIAVKPLPAPFFLVFLTFKIPIKLSVMYYYKDPKPITQKTITLLLSFCCTTQNPTPHQNSSVLYGQKSRSSHSFCPAFVLDFRYSSTPRFPCIFRVLEKLIISLSWVFFLFVIFITVVGIQV